MGKVERACVSSDFFAIVPGWTLRRAAAHVVQRCPKCVGSKDNGAFALVSLRPVCPPEVITRPLRGESLGTAKGGRPHRHPYRVRVADLRRGLGLGHQRIEGVRHELPAAVLLAQGSDLC